MFNSQGDGTCANRDRPLTVPGVRNAVAIAAGGYRSVAVLADGTDMGWGANHVNLTPRPVPALVRGARGIRSVVAGGDHVAAITQTGEVLTWGQNAHYESDVVGMRTRPGRQKGLRRQVAGCRREYDRRRARIGPDDDVGRGAPLGSARRGAGKSEPVSDSVVARWGSNSRDSREHLLA